MSTYDTEQKVVITLCPDNRMNFEQACAMIKQLLERDVFEEVARLKNGKQLLECAWEIFDKFLHIGDSVVVNLVRWTKHLPFYQDLPVPVHTQLLSRKWPELLVLTSCVYLAIRGSLPIRATALRSLCECLTISVGKPMELEDLLGGGPLVEQMIQLADTFHKMGLLMEEYVCLKVIIMQSQEEASDKKDLVKTIHDRYMKALRIYTQYRFPEQATRYSELLSCIPRVQAAASLLVQNKMFYVPLFLNTNIKSKSSELRNGQAA